MASVEQTFGLPSRQLGMSSHPGKKISIQMDHGDSTLAVLRQTGQKKVKIVLLPRCTLNCHNQSAPPPIYT